jgi:Uma2 family endonuclease
MVYVSKEKWSLDRARPDDNAWDVVPDLCAEVVSPSDHSNEIRTEIREYFSAGVPIVWIVYPDDETVNVYTGKHTHQTLTRSDTLSAGTIIPGFELPLA